MYDVKHWDVEKQLLYLYIMNTNEQLQCLY